MHAGHRHLQHQVSCTGHPAVTSNQFTTADLFAHSTSTRPRGLGFMPSSLHPGHYEEWNKGGKFAAAAETTLMCTRFEILTAEQDKRLPFGGCMMST